MIEHVNGFGSKPGECPYCSGRTDDGLHPIKGEYDLSAEYKARAFECKRSTGVLFDHEPRHLGKAKLS